MTIQRPIVQGGGVVEASVIGNRFVAQTSPFADARADTHLPPGMTILQMLDYVELKEAYRPFAHVTLSSPDTLGEPVYVPQHLWGKVRPKPGVTVVLRCSRGKGGKGGKKSILGIILKIVVMILAVVASIWGGPAAGAAVMALGNLAINALIKPPKQPTQNAPAYAGSLQSATLYSATGGQNQEAAYAPIQRLYGKHRMSPYHAAKPYTELEGADQYLRMLFCLGYGPLDIDQSSFKIGETLLSDYDNVEIQIRQGFADDEPIGLYSNRPRESPGVSIEIANNGIRTEAGKSVQLLAISGGNANDAGTVTIISRVYTFRTAITTAANDVLIGATAEASLFNLASAINRWAGSGTLYSAATTVNTDVVAAEGAGDTMLITAATGGVAGNDNGTTETLTNGAWSDWILTVTGQPSNADTVTIGAKTYTFQTVLTNTDGNVKIGASAAETLQNLAAAVMLSAGAGTAFAAATTLHATAKAAAISATRFGVWPKTAGSALSTSEAMANATWGNATMSGGTAEVSNDPLTEDEIWVSQTTLPDTDEVSFDITFPKGLVEFLSGGGRSLQTARFDVRYRLTGSGDPWTYVSVQSSNILTLSGQPADGQAVTIGAKGYTFQTSLTNVDGNVAIGADVAGSLANLAAAINLGAGAGTAYAVLMTIHPVVSAVSGATSLTATAKHVGNATGPDGDTIACSETLTNGSWQAATMFGGTDAITITSKETSVRIGKRFVPATRGQFDLEIRRLTRNSTSDQIYNESFLTTVRSIQYGSPVTLPGLALIAIRIKATDQLNGVVNIFNCIATAMLPIWDGAAWLDPVATRNPAWAYVNELRGSHIATPVADSKLDLAGIKAWADACDVLSQDGLAQYTCDGVFSDSGRVKDRLRDIAAAGRVSFGVRNDQFSVIRDIPQATPVGHISPLNSWSFQSTRRYDVQPHGIKVQYINEAKGYQQDELIVYADGYTKDNASLFEAMTFPMVVRERQIWSDTRYHQAVAKLRPETYKVTMDIEHMAFVRGDLVMASHDVPLWGISRGRVKAVTLNGSDELVSITLDEAVTFEAGKDYCIRIRRADNSSQVITLANTPGVTNVLAPLMVLTAPDIPEKGNVGFFGESGRESVALLVEKIEPGQDFSAIITLIDASPAVHDADQGTIPPFDPGITDPVPIFHKLPNVPTIANIRSDETVLSVNTDGSYVAAIVLDFAVATGGDVPAAYVRLQYRRTGDGAGWHNVGPIAVATGQVQILGVDIGEMYDIRAEAISQAGTLSEWSSIHTHTVVGDTSLPPDVENPRLSGDDVLWDYPAPPRDFMGGGFRIKAVAGTVPNREAGFLLTDGLVTITSYNISALSNGVYTVMVIAVDRAGNESANAPYVVIDRGAPTIINAIVTTDFAATNFPGTITNGTVDTGAHVLTADLEATQSFPEDGTIAAFPENGDVEAFDTVAMEMTYIFDVTVSAGDANSSLKVTVTETGAPWSLEYSTDDGASYAPWPGFILSEAATYTFRLVTAGGGDPGEITGLTAILDVEDEEEFLSNVAVTAGGINLTLQRAYRFIDFVGATPVFHSGEAATSLRIDDHGTLNGAGNLVVTGPGVTPFAGIVAADGHFNIHVHGAKAL